MAPEKSSKSIYRRNNHTKVTVHFIYAVDSEIYDTTILRAEVSIHNAIMAIARAQEQGNSNGASKHVAAEELAAQVSKFERQCVENAPPKCKHCPGKTTYVHQRVMSEFADQQNPIVRVICSPICSENSQCHAKVRQDVEDRMARANKIGGPDNPAVRFIFCKLCGKSEGAKKCGKCLAVAYCCREHQITDWPEHKRVCGKTSKVTEKKLVCSLPCRLCGEKKGTNYCIKCFRVGYCCEEHRLEDLEHQQVCNVLQLG